MGEEVCNPPYAFFPSYCLLWAVARLSNCYWAHSSFVFFSCKPQFIKYLDKAMGRMKELDNLELKNSLVIWFYLFFGILYFWIWKMTTEVLQTAFAVNLLSYIRDQTVYITLQSENWWAANLFYLTLRLTFQVRIVLLLKKWQLEFCAYMPILSNPALTCRNTSCTGEGEVILCVCRGQGIMEIRDLQ